jgi:hypothetical protein
MNDNCIYFHLKKLQLGPIDAAFQELQYRYGLKNSARANFFLFFFFSHVFSTVFIVDLAAIKFKTVCTSSKFNTFYLS